MRDELPPGRWLSPWDQARVTEIAKQMSDATDAWRLTVRQENDSQLGSGTAEEGFELTRKSLVVAQQARSLAGHLAAGQGRDQTYNSFRSLKEEVDDVEVISARAELEKPAIDAWAKVAGLMAQIKPYYEP